MLNQVKKDLMKCGKGAAECVARSLRPKGMSLKLTDAQGRVTSSRTLIVANAVGSQDQQ